MMADEKLSVDKKSLRNLLVALLLMWSTSNTAQSRFQVRRSYTSLVVVNVLRNTADGDNVGVRIDIAHFQKIIRDLYAVFSLWIFDSLHRVISLGFCT